MKTLPETPLRYAVVWSSREEDPNIVYTEKHDIAFATLCGLMSYPYRKTDSVIMLDLTPADSEKAEVVCIGFKVWDDHNGWTFEVAFRTN